MDRTYTIRPDASGDHLSPRQIDCADDREALARAAELKSDVEVWERERLVGVCWVRPLTKEAASLPSAGLVVAGMVASSGAATALVLVLSALTD
jgi:type II secretory pathway component PulC